MYQQLKKMRQEEGFTLIELLIVIVILGILAAIVVFSVSGVTDRGNLAACKQDVTTIQTAAEAYYAENSTYPANYAALNTGGFIHGTTAPTEFTITFTTTAAPTFATNGTTPAGCSTVF